VALAALALWACNAAIRLWMNACIAWAGSEVVLDELDDEELVDGEADDPLALEVEVLSPVAPICESASMMEFIKPPPDGGGGGGGVAELTSEEFVTSDCVVVLLVLVVAASCASQLLMLETLLIVMSISVSVKIESKHNINDTFPNSCEPGNKKAGSDREQLLRILTGGIRGLIRCRTHSKRGRPVPCAAKVCRF
jgi:hypothetical protein